MHLNGGLCHSLAGPLAPPRRPLPPGPGPLAPQWRCATTGGAACTATAACATWSGAACTSTAACAATGGAICTSAAASATWSGAACAATRSQKQQLSATTCLRARRFSERELSKNGPRNRARNWRMKRDPRNHPLNQLASGGVRNHHETGLLNQSWFNAPLSTNAIYTYMVENFFRGLETTPP